MTVGRHTAARLVARTVLGALDDTDRRPIRRGKANVFLLDYVVAERPVTTRRASVTHETAATHGDPFASAVPVGSLFAEAVHEGRSRKDPRCH